MNDWTNARDNYLKNLPNRSQESAAPLMRLIDIAQGEKESAGVTDTPGEIAQQPWTWRETATLIQDNNDLIQSFLDSLNGQIVFAGAGTSDFVGQCLVPLFHDCTKLTARSVPTTHLVTSLHHLATARDSGGVVHFARSGNSPESLGTIAAIHRELPEVKHLVITCNKDGGLARFAAKHEIACLVLPPATNDAGLAMTSSCSSMILAGQGVAHAQSQETFMRAAGILAKAGEDTLVSTPATLAEIAEKPFDRACYLGSNGLFGAAVEAHLKLQEMTGGQVISMAESFLGFRHGPMSVVNDKTLIICMVSNNPWTLGYEIDLMKEIRAKELGMHVLALAPDQKTADRISDLADTILLLSQTEHMPLSANHMPPLYLIPVQLLALFASMARGLKPDAPSPTGTINRVVQGVVIYDRQEFDNGAGLVPWQFDG